MNANVPRYGGYRHSPFPASRTRSMVWTTYDTTSQERSVAKGKKCPSCSTNMFAEVEDDQPKGRWVTYACLNTSCTMREKVFESYPG